MQACFNQFAYSCCMWQNHNISSNTSTSTLKSGILSLSLCWQGENWMDNTTGALMSLAHSGGSSGAPRPGCPWRGCLSAAGLSLIYGGRQWLAGRAGGVQAPSLSQPQLKANYIFISLWSGWTRTDLWSQPETDMDLIPLSSWSGADMMIIRDKYDFNICDATTWDKVQYMKSITNYQLHHHSLLLDEMITRCFKCIFKKPAMAK